MSNSVRNNLLGEMARRSSGAKDFESIQKETKVDYQKYNKRSACCVATVTLFMTRI